MLLKVLWSKHRELSEHGSREYYCRDIGIRTIKMVRTESRITHVSVMVNPVHLLMDNELLIGLSGWCRG